MNKDLAGETLYTDGNFPVLLGTTAENLKNEKNSILLAKLMKRYR